MQGVNVGNQYQVGATNIQGGAGINIDSAASVLGLSGGTVNVVTPDDIAATGNIDIHSGASSTTASGNVTVDTGAGIVTGTVVDTRDFESGVDAMTAWFGDTIAQSSAQAHGGADSLAVTATGSFVGIIQDGNVSFVPIVAGHHYFFSAWVRAATTPRLWSPGIQWIGGAGSLALNTVTDSTSGWTQVTGSGIAPAGATGAIWKFSTSGESAGEIHYFDDFVTTDLSSSSAVSELDLGATNAQIITIGNMNELGATTINGGSGITMNSGQANFTVNGGAVTINGSGSSALSTSAGSLTLSGIDTSTWGLDTSLSGNGGDLTLHAGTGAGGGNNGGNLILQGGAADSTGTSGAVNINTMSGTGA